MKNIAIILSFFVLLGCSNNSNKTENFKTVDIKLCCQPENKIDYRNHFTYIPKEIKIYFDLNEAIEIAKKQEKPILMIFSGFSCKSQRNLDWQIFNNNQCIELIKENFIFTILLVDDMSKLKDNYINDEGLEVNSLGSCYNDFQIKKYNSNAQPLYCIVDYNIVDQVEPITYNADTKVGYTFLNKGLMQYNNGW